MQVTQVTPSIMSSLSLAMGIDYSLFILSRIQQELVHSDIEHAILTSLQNAGYSILISGCTIMLCLFGLMLLPLQSFLSLGLGSGIAILSCLAVNLTLVPAILFTQFGRGLVLWKNCKRREDQLLQPLLSDLDDDIHPIAPPLELFGNSFYEKNDPIDQIPSSSIQAPHQHQHQHQHQPTHQIENEEESKKGLWFKFGNTYIHYPRNIFMFLLITFIILPFALYTPKLKTSISNQLLLPSNSQALKAYNDLSSIFGQGYLNPYKIIFDGTHSNQTVTSQHGFDIMHKVYNQLYYKDSSNISYSGISVLAHKLIDYDIYTQAMQCGIYCVNEPLATIAYVNSIYTANPYVSYFTVVLDMDPYSVQGTEWLISSRNIIDELKSNHELEGYDVYIQAGASVVYDAMIYTFKSFPTMIIVTSIVVLLFMGISFQSIITPLRSLMSIAYTLLFSYGLFVLVYQYGILDWTGLRSLSSYKSHNDQYGQISFIPPIMAFTVIVGLSLDYDVFLITRIYEYRIYKKYHHKSSILLGLQGTGRIITAAGLIMFIAFGGLLASECLLLNQYAFLLMASVLLDTFVVRTVLVPTLLSFSGSVWSWWPNRFVGDGELSVFPSGVELNS